jgi:hypothetical protein
VIKNAAKIDEIVPLISLYANSQNKIQAADFDANQPFHRTLEELSRTIWAPSRHGLARQTRWFYERSRGQYIDMRERTGTPARKRAFDEEQPRSQKFTKTDVAKFENSWGQLPYFVSRGAQKNFREFAVRLAEKKNFLPDQKYFEHLVAKAILFKETEQIVQSHGIAGYRSQIVTYTLALVAHLSSQRIDLDRIWKDQNITPVLRAEIDRISRRVRQAILEQADGNIAEWCKKEACWKGILGLGVELSEDVRSELIDSDAAQTGTSGSPVLKGPATAEEVELVEKIASVPAEQWLALSAWAKQTNNLQGWQRALAYSLGTLKGRKPSIKQATQGIKILDEADRLGFTYLAEEAKV